MALLSKSRSLAPLSGSCLLRGRANGGKGSGEVLEGFGERGSHVVDRKGDELQPSIEFLEGRDERKGIFYLFRDFVAASEVFV